MNTKYEDIPTLTRVRRISEDEVRQKPLELRLYKRMFGYTGNNRQEVRWLVLCVLLRGVQGPAMAWCLSWILNGPVAKGGHAWLWGACGLYILLAFFTDFVLYYRLWLALLVGEGVVHDLRNDMFDHLQKMSMSFFGRNRLGRLISRFTSDVESVRAGVQDAVFMGLVNLAMMLFSAVLMLCFNWRLSLMMLVVAPIYYAVYHIFRRRLSEATRAVQESFSRLTATLAESVNGMRVTQGFARQDVNAQAWNALIVDHSHYNMAVARATGQFQPVVELLNQLAIGVVFVASAWLVLRSSHPSPVEDLVLFYFLANNLLAPLAVLGNQYNTAMSSMAGAERAFLLLDEKPELVDEDDAAELPPIQGRVEFKDLSFGYNPQKLVLRDVNFVAEPGQTIALVGHTGSGKSTIINLISKFYLPTAGSLTIDGHEIRKIKASSLHRQMGIVLQANFLFTGTVMDNIRVGRRSAADAEVQKAADALGCLDIFEALPQGLMTRVGERGAGLSLGQRQLVCFARAMLADPRIMILDEATSAVDTVTEARIQQALSVLLKGRTSFVVAHRLSTIRHADVVLVLDRGRIVERGTHNDLLATGGVYANLYQQFIQASKS
ncbi:MAG: ABC transporter ATP-binding protein [Planctomycetota bacterium]|nr:ABC transporter ATP-binding protein [Planctomycetota bacterium]